MMMKKEEFFPNNLSCREFHFHLFQINHTCLPTFAHVFIVFMEMVAYSNLFSGKRLRFPVFFLSNYTTKKTRLEFRIGFPFFLYFPHKQTNKPNAN